MRVAVYPSVLYGADFIEESIRSILPHVDRVFVVMMKKPWGDTEGVGYKGEWVTWPMEFDNTREKVQMLIHDCHLWRDQVVGHDHCHLITSVIEIIESYKFSPWDRWGFAVNEVVRKQCDPTEVVLIDPDCVFSEAEAEKTFAEWESHPEYTWAQPRQIELWKTPKWQVVRPRSMVTLCRGDLSLLSADVRKARGVQAPESHWLDSTVYNLGFCVSESAMRWKHLTALAFSPVIGESLPNPDWFEEKWVNWKPETRNLEISIGCEGSIPCAVPYTDMAALPMSICQRFGL